MVVVVVVVAGGVLGIVWVMGVSRVWVKLVEGLMGWGILGWEGWGWVVGWAEE